MNPLGQSRVQSSFWEAIDAICIINLAHRGDRLEAIRSQLEACRAPQKKIHRIDAVWGKQLPGFMQHPLFRNCTEEEAHFWAGRAGCLLSHRACVEWAAKRGYERILILEDDAEFVTDLQGPIGAMLADTALNGTEWDLFYLGMTPYCNRAQAIAAADAPAGTVHVARIMGPLCTHCYLTHERAYPKLLQRLPTSKNVWSWLAFHLSYDSWIANEFGREPEQVILGCYPNLCIQGESYSDIEDTVLTHNQGALGGAPHPVAFVEREAFEAEFHTPSFLLKKGVKIAAHYLLGLYYFAAGYRKFSVSIESAGYRGAFLAACKALRGRKQPQ